MLGGQLNHGWKRCFSLNCTFRCCVGRGDVIHIVIRGSYFSGNWIPVKGNLILMNYFATCRVIIQLVLIKNFKVKCYVAVERFSTKIGYSCSYSLQVKV